MYVEDLKRGTNKDIGPKDIFEMGSKQKGRNVYDSKDLIFSVHVISDDIYFVHRLRRTTIGS